MDLLIAPNTVTQAQSDQAPATGTPGWATDGNPATNTPATIFPAYAFNALQAELTAAIQAAGITLDRTKLNQLALAIQKMTQGASAITAPDTGAVNALAITLSPAPTALTPGMMVAVDNIVATNTGPATLNVNGLGALPIGFPGLGALQGAELVAGFGALLRLDHAGTAWVLIASTGTTVGPSPSAFDASTRLVTTAFLRTALGSFANVGIVQGVNTVLTASAVGQIIQVIGAACTITLPNNPSIPAGGAIWFYGQGGSTGGPYTISAPAGGFIYCPGAGMSTGNTTLTLGANDSLCLVSRGASNEWDVAGGSWITTNAAVTFSGAQSGTAPPAADNSAKLPTTAWAQANMFGGANQAWQNLTASRALNTTYTNTTGRTIKVLATGAATSNTTELDLYDNGQKISQSGVDIINGLMEVALEIPNGHTYEVTSVNANLNTWWEYR